MSTSHNIIDVKEKDGKYIFSKGGVYFGLTYDQVRQMKKLCDMILAPEKKDAV